MVAAQVPFQHDRQEELVAQLTDIAYQTVLRHGLRGAFVDVELDLWRRIRDAYQNLGERTSSHAQR